MNVRVSECEVHGEGLLKFVVECEFRVSGYVRVTMHTPTYANHYSYMLPLPPFSMSF